jgi:NADPH:quinone reductase-like Zn-dependent oxidoreductase
VKAIVQREYGSDPVAVLRYEDVPTPDVGPGEVLIRVEAAGVDRGTLHLMTGTPLLARVVGFGLRRPRTPVPGRSVAGTVVDTGERVFGVALGAFAEYAVARRDRLVPVPAALSACEAAALPDSAVTALQAVRDHGAVRPGDRVAVLGASGGVGCFAVQLAKDCGAHVTGVAGPAKQDFVASLGADVVLDYTRTGLGAEQFDVVIDIAGNRGLRALRRVLAPRGRLVIVGGEGGSRLLGGVTRNAVATVLSPFTRQTLRAFVTRASTADMATLADMVATGRLRSTIDRSHPLVDTAAALRDLADGRVRGKVVVVP